MLTAKSPIDLTVLEGVLSEAGLLQLGIFQFCQEHLSEAGDAYLGSTGILIGNAGPAMWEVISNSEVYADGEPDPINRWTESVLEPLSCQMGVEVIYPFQEPYFPFQRLLQAATGLAQSPLGLFIHPQFGLWHALRGCLVVDPGREIVSQNNSSVSKAQTLIHPCDSCEDKPCLSACPVGAFTGQALEVGNCFEHLDSGEDPQCMNAGCRARDACPVGKKYRYTPEQIRFHMQYYRG